VARYAIGNRKSGRESREGSIPSLSAIMKIIPLIWLNLSALFLLLGALLATK
jgi:hypothetical protein